MAVESKRGCGFRTVDGLYLVSDGVSFPCDRLTFEIPEICECCGNGTKFSRGWTWLNAAKFFGGDHVTPLDEHLGEDRLIKELHCDCCDGNCSVCRPAKMGERSALLWIGEKHYSPTEFKAEAYNMGVSKKIPAVPRDLEVGKTWVLCAHKKAIRRTEVVPDPGEDGDDFEVVNYPGVFFAFQPTRIERIVKQTNYDLFVRVETMTEDDREVWLKGNPYPGESALKRSIKSLARQSGTHTADVKRYKEMKRDHKRGITFVPVPDDDPDHNPEVKK